MNEMTMTSARDETNAGIHDLQVVEYKGQRVITTALLAEVYNTDVNNLHMNFARNPDRFIEGVHFFKLEGLELREFKSLPTVNGLVDKFSPTLILWSKRGASRHCKFLGTDEAWEQFDILEETYFNGREEASALNTLSPQLQVLINLEMRQKENEKAIAMVNQRLDDTRDIIALNPTSWRSEARDLIVKIAQQMGGNDFIRNVQSDIYKLVDERAGVSLSVRLTNKRRRMADEGVCKSKRDKLNKIDVIADDKKLIEIYVAVVKEYAIKYGVTAA